MITTTIRNLSHEEKQKLIKRLPTKRKRLGSFVMKLVGVILILLAPLLIYDNYYPVASNTLAVCSIIIVLLSLLITNKLTKKFEGDISNNKRSTVIDSMQVEVIKVKTNRAVKREEYDDFGIAYYIDVTVNEQRKTLYLWGRYLNELEYEKLFPNTEFEFIRKASTSEFVDFKTSGQYFKEEKTLSAFDKQVWQSGNYPVNGQLLDLTVDTIT